MAERQHMLNGRLVPESELAIPARDIGLLRGYGVFDFLITYHGGRPFHLADHIDRLYRSASIVGLDIPWARSVISEWTHEALAANAASSEEHQIRIVLTGGVGLDSITASADDPTLIIFIDPHVPYSRSCYDEGVGVTTIRYTRHLPGAKSLDYIEGVRQIADARRRDAVEVVYYDDRQLFEGATSNVFVLRDGTLRTPASRVLEGITRRILLDHLSLAEPVVVADFPIEHLQDADELFLTASNKEVMPVTRVDGQPVGDGQVGRVTRQVMAQFRDYARRSKNL